MHPQENPPSDNQAALADANLNRLSSGSVKLLVQKNLPYHDAEDVSQNFALWFWCQCKSGRLKVIIDPEAEYDGDILMPGYIPLKNGDRPPADRYLRGCLTKYAAAYWRQKANTQASTDQHKPGTGVVEPLPIPDQQASAPIDYSMAIALIRSEIGKPNLLQIFDILIKGKKRKEIVQSLDLPHTTYDKRRQHLINKLKKLAAANPQFRSVLIALKGVS